MWRILSASPNRSERRTIASVLRLRPAIETSLERTSAGPQRSEAAGQPGAPPARLTPSRIASETTSAASSDTASTSPSTRPVDAQKTVSPSNGVHTGEIDRATPALAARAQQLPDRTAGADADAAALDLLRRGLACRVPRPCVRPRPGIPETQVVDDRRSNERHERNGGLEADAALGKPADNPVCSGQAEG